MRTSLPVTVVSLFAVLCVGCGLPTAPGDQVASKLSRLTDSAPAADLNTLVSGNTDFAIDLYRAMSVEHQNVFLSPHSVSLALSLAYAGSANATTKAFEHTLHIGLPQAQYHAAMNDLDRQLSSRGANAAGADGGPFRLAIANQLFAQKGFAFVPAYLDVLAQQYGAGARVLDFATKSEASRVDINDWVSAMTQGHISELLPKGFITADTRAVLVNAVSFSAAWAKKFDPANSKPVPFHALDETSTPVTGMYDREMNGSYAHLDDVDVVSLPYDGKQLSLVVLMPKAGTFTTYEQHLTTATLNAAVAALTPQALELTMPTFELRTSADLGEALQKLGLANAFDSSADFSRMSTADQLAISGVVHQAWVKVSEAGTEAAAATGVVVGRTVSLPVTIPVVVDRPFIFLVRDDATGTVLFMGRFVQPS